MSILAKVRSIEGTVIDSGGENITIRLLPGLDTTELAALKARIPIALPDNMRELFKECRGLCGLLPEIDFSGLPGFAFPEVFPHGLPIAHDGSGNYWVVDFEPSSAGWGPIFFACHDPAVLVYQCDSIESFVDQLLCIGKSDFDDPIGAVSDQHSLRAWRNRSNFKHPSDLTATERDGFIQPLGDRDLIFDFRQPILGQGFPWGLYGPRTEIQRHTSERLFVIRHKTWWHRFWGK